MSKANDLAILIRHLSYNSSSDQIETDKGTTSKGKEYASHTSTSTTEVAIASFSSTTYRSAKILVAMTQGSEYQALELHLVHDGSSVDMTQYGQIQSSSLATFDADISGGNVRLLATPTSVTSTSFEVDLSLVDA